MVKSWYPERYPCFGRHQACGLVFPYIKYGCYSPNCRDYQLIIDKVATAVSVDTQSIETVRFLFLALHGRVQFWYDAISHYVVCSRWMWFFKLVVLSQGT